MDPFLRAAIDEAQIVNDPECIAMMEKFIAEHPALWNEDIGCGSD